MSLADGDGTFWFVSAAEPDLDVRIVNFCGIGGTYGVFAGGLVDEGVVTLTVTDTKTGATKTYENDPGTSFIPVHDAVAFATCP